MPPSPTGRKPMPASKSDESRGSILNSSAPRSTSLPPSPALHVSSSSTREKKSAAANRSSLSLGGLNLEDYHRQHRRNSSSRRVSSASSPRLTARPPALPLHRAALSPSTRPQLFLPPPPPQSSNIAATGAGGAGVGGGWTGGLRDLDGCVVWYTDDSAAEADIESMASVASVDSREDDFEAAASTDSEVASTASSTGGASSVCSGESSRGRPGNHRDLSLSLCSTWSEEGEEDVLLGLSLARARMTAGKAACSCRETSCFCRFKKSSFTSTGRTPMLNLRTTVPLLPLPLAKHELDPRDVALVAEINRMTSGGRDRSRSGDEEKVDKEGFSRGYGSTPDGEVADGAGLAVHQNCALEFAERFVRRDITLVGRVQAVRLLKGSASTIFNVVVRCGGFRALYGWLGDVWERVRAHKLPRAGPPDWAGVGGRVYVEELLNVLSRVPISVDMLRETEISRVAKKFRRLAERHGLEAMTAASNGLRVHLHAVVSKGVQEGLFFRNRAIGRSVSQEPNDRRSSSYPPSQQQQQQQQQHPYPASNLPYPPSQTGFLPGSSAKGFGEYSGTRGRSMYAALGGSGCGGGSDGGGSLENSSSKRRDDDRHFGGPISLSALNIEYRSTPGLRSARLRGWRRRQGGNEEDRHLADAVGSFRGGGGWGDGDGTNSIRSGGEGSDAGSSIRGEDDIRAAPEDRSSHRRSNIISANMLSSKCRESASKRKAKCESADEQKEGTRESGTGELQIDTVNGAIAEGGGGLADATANGNSSEASSVSARSSQRSFGGHATGGRGGVMVESREGGSRRHSRRGSRRGSRRRISRTEPFVLNFSNSGGEEKRRVREADEQSLQFDASYSRFDGEPRRGEGAREEGWYRRHVRGTGDGGGGGGGTSGSWRFRPLHRDDGGLEDSPSTFRPGGFRPDSLESVSEDGSWEGSVDWWLRPRSPQPSGAGDTYYPHRHPTPGDYEYNASISGGMGMPATSSQGTHPFMLPGQQGTAPLLPAVPTFEESGTRVSWADYRGHSLAEVHEIEPGYSREDFVLPGRVGFITEACRRDMSKKEEQLLSPEDHERLAAAALESDVLRGRAYGGGAGGGGDSEGTISDSENSTTGDPDFAHYENNNSRGNGLRVGRGAGGRISPTTSPPSPASSSCGGDRNDGAGADEEGGISPRNCSYNGPRNESCTGSPQNGSPQTSPASSAQNSSNSSPTRDPDNLVNHRERGESEGGSESGCSSLQSPQRFFSSVEDDVSSPPGSPTSGQESPRRLTSLSGRCSSPPRSPSFSFPGSSRSGSVAGGNVMFENRSSSDRRHVVCRPPLDPNSWNHHQQCHDRHLHQHQHEHHRSSREPSSRWGSKNDTTSKQKRRHLLADDGMSLSGVDNLSKNDGTGDTTDNREDEGRENDRGQEDGEKNRSKGLPGSSGGGINSTTSTSNNSNNNNISSNSNNNSINSNYNGEGAASNAGRAVSRPWEVGTSQESHEETLWQAGREMNIRSDHHGCGSKGSGTGRMMAARVDGGSGSVLEAKPKAEHDEDDEEEYRHRVTAAALVSVEHIEDGNDTLSNIGNRNDSGHNNSPSTRGDPRRRRHGEVFRDEEREETGRGPSLSLGFEGGLGRGNTMIRQCGSSRSSKRCRRDIGGDKMPSDRVSELDGVVDVGGSADSSRPS